MKESKRLRLYTIDQSLNRLSKLQRKILIAAYQHYAVNPDLAPVGTPFGMKAKLGVAHLYSYQAVASYLHRHAFGHEGFGSHFTIDPDDKSSYQTAQSAISRSFARMESRGLVERMKREFMYNAGIQLTQKGIDLGCELTGLKPVPRNWKAETIEEN